MIAAVRLTPAFSEHIRWISKILNQALDSAQSTSLAVDARIYITGPNYTMPELPASDSSSRNSDNGDSIPGTPLSPISEKSFNEKQELPVYSAIRLTHGRPSISRILQEEISASSGPVSVDGEPQFGHLCIKGPILTINFSRWPFCFVSSCFQCTRLTRCWPRVRSERRSVCFASCRGFWDVIFSTPIHAVSCYNSLYPYFPCIHMTRESCP